jgi:sporulation protein YlmC with PRC-barrel domain
MSTPNPVNYCNYDFEDLKTELENRLKLNNVWRDTYESSTGQMLIEFYAYIANLILFYLERRVEEGYISTAQNKSSILNLVRLINYSPKRVTSAVGTLEFSITDSSSTRIFIPQYTSCQTANAVKFLTIQDITIEPGQLSNTVAGIQGELVELEYAGDGSIDREININDMSVENDAHIRYRPFYSFRVLIDGVEWTKVSSFLSSDNTDTHYKLKAELDDTVTVIFGDDINGKAPESDSTIQIKYIKSDGADGNIYETGKVTTLNDVIYDENETATAVAVTNSTTCPGGDDAEDIEEIRAEAPDVFAIGDRLVIKDDFTAFIINYESVAEVNVWGENEESPPNYDMFNTVRLCILLDSWNHPPTAFKTDLSTALYEKSMITVKYEYIQAVILDTIVTIDAVVNKGYSLSQTQSDIEDAITAHFVLGSTTKLGESKYVSNLVESVDALPAILYHHLELEIRKALTARYTSGWDYGETLDALPILPGSVEVYATVTGVGSDILMAVDDEIGAFTDVSSSYTVTGEIDYDTGVVNIEFEPDTYIESVYVKYKQDANNDIITGYSQICKLYTTTISSIAYES